MLFFEKLWKFCNFWRPCHISEDHFDRQCRKESQEFGSGVLAPHSRMSEEREIERRIGAVLRKLFANALPVPRYGRIANHVVREDGEIQLTIRIHIAEGEFRPDDFWSIQLCDFTDRDEFGNEMVYGFKVSEDDRFLHANYIRAHGEREPGLRYPRAVVTVDGVLPLDEGRKKLDSFLSSFDRLGVEMGPNFRVSAPIRGGR